MQEVKWLKVLIFFTAETGDVGVTSYLNIEY